MIWQLLPFLLSCSLTTICIMNLHYKINNDKANSWFVFWKRLYASKLFIYAWCWVPILFSSSTSLPSSCSSNQGTFASKHSYSRFKLTFINVKYGHTCTHNFLSTIRYRPNIKMSRNTRFHLMWYVRPAKPHISLRIRAVW